MRLFSKLHHNRNIEIIQTLYLLQCTVHLILQFGWIKGITKSWAVLENGTGHLVFGRWNRSWITNHRKGRNLPRGEISLEVWCHGSWPNSQALGHTHHFLLKTFYFSKKKKIFILLMLLSCLCFTREFSVWMVLEAHFLCWDILVKNMFGIYEMYFLYITNFWGTIAIKQVCLFHS